MNRATILIGVVLAMWWVWPLPDEPAQISSSKRRVTRPRIRIRRSPPRPTPSEIRRYAEVVAEHAADLTCDLLELERRRVEVPLDGSEADVAGAVARIIVREHAPHAPPLLEEGLVRHIQTHFDGTWTNEAKLKADAARVAADGFLDLADLLESRDPLYAMLFIDLLVYSEDPMLVGKLAPLYSGTKREAVKLLKDDRLHERWREQLTRFANTRWTIPPVYR